MGLAKAQETESGDFENGFGGQSYEDRYDFIMLIRGFFPDSDPVTDAILTDIRNVFLACGHYWHCYKPMITLQDVPGTNRKSVEICMDVGDVMEEEWYAVSPLLYQISRSYPKSAWKFEDPYGCILSAQLSDDLPEWMDYVEDPENRVYMQQGVICYYKRDKNNPVDLRKVANSQLEAASLRINGTFAMSLGTMGKNERFKPKLHKARVCLPRKGLEYLNLRENLSLIVKVVHSEAVLEIDDVSKLKTFEPKDFVETTLEFTRKQFENLIDFDLMPPKNYPKLANHKERVGCRLTVGLEAAIRLSKIPLDKAPNADLCEDEEDDVNKWIVEDVDQQAILEEYEHGLQDLLKMPREPRRKQNDDEDEDEGEYSSDSDLKYIYDNYEWSDCEDYSDEDEDEEDLLQQEILETLKHDPDLLMRIIELNAEAGHDSTELVELLKNLNITPAMSRQKGVSDIDPQRLAEARQPRERPEYSDDDEEECSDLSNDDGEDDLPYGETAEEAKKQKRVIDHKDD